MQSNEDGVVRRLVLAEGVTRVGDAVSLLAVPLVAILLLGASPAELALLGAAQAVPILVLSLPAGAWVDGRRRRWPILVVADLVRAALLLAVPILAATGHLTLPVLIAIAAASSAAGTLFDVGLAGWVPRLVFGDRLHLANSRIELARSSAAVSGPALGGALVAALGAPMALLADAASFLGSALLIGSLRHREPPLTTQAEPGGIGSRVLDGFRFVVRQPLIRAVVATAALNNLARSTAMAIAILYLVDVGRLAPEVIGLCFALGHTGFLAGAVLSRRISGALGMGRTMQLGVGLFGPSMLAFAVAPADLAAPAFTLMVFANGFGIAIHNVNQVTVRQMLTPDWLRSRVAAVTRLAIFGAIPIGTLLGGLVAEFGGLRAALLVGAVGLFAGALPYLVARVDSLRTVEQLAPT